MTYSNNSNLNQNSEYSPHSRKIENCFRIRLAFEAIFRKSATLQDVDPDPELGGTLNSDNQHDSLDGANQPMLTPSPAVSKKVQLV